MKGRKNVCAGIRAVLLGVTILFLAGAVAGCGGQEEGERTQVVEETRNALPSMTEAASDPAEEQTLQDRAEAVREVVVDYWNNEVIRRGDGLNSEAEWNSLQFYDMYVTEPHDNKNNNWGGDLIVRYTYRDDDTEGDWILTAVFKFSPGFAQTLRSTVDGGDIALDVFIEGMNEQEDVTEFMFTTGAGFDQEIDDKLAEGCMIRWTNQEMQELFEADSDQ